jgi:acetoin utilization deacetylase AcuC-like enzyme/drug/metabolite transporter (DMT)-like permease
MRKYSLLRERVLVDVPGLLMHEAPRAGDDALLLAHAPDYVSAVSAGRLDPARQREIGFPWSPEMVERSRRSAGATMAACAAAMTDGIAVNLAGGTHHAYADKGAGFCVFNDAAIASRWMQRQRGDHPIAFPVAIVDLDVHQGNGTASILGGDASMFTLSLHGEKNYPFRKEASDLDVGLPDGCGDAAYLEALAGALDTLAARFAPRLIIYLAGADPHEGDRLGRLKLTMDGLAHRDQQVFDFAQHRRYRGRPRADHRAGRTACSALVCEPGGTGRGCRRSDSPTAFRMSQAYSATPASARDSHSLFVVAMPWLFVLIWSTGFIVAKYGMPYAEPIIDWRTIGHLAVAGALMQWGYLAGVWAAIKLGMPAGMSALIVGMQPILTALYVSMRGERVTGRQWLGLLCGIAGVGLVVANKLHLAGVGVTTLALCLGALLSITVGTLYQKRHCPVFDLRMGACIQFGASALLCLPFMFLFETREVHWTAQMIGALVWSVLALSIGAISLLFVLIRKGAATKVTSLLYLTPPTTAVMAWALFGERFPPLAALGMVIAACGVALVIRK